MRSWLVLESYLPRSWIAKDIVYMCTYQSQSLGLSLTISRAHISNAFTYRLATMEMPWWCLDGVSIKL